MALCAETKSVNVINQCDGHNSRTSHFLTLVKGVVLVVSSYLSSGSKNRDSRMLYRLESTLTQKCFSGCMNKIALTFPKPKQRERMDDIVNPSSKCKTTNNTVSTTDLNLQQWNVSATILMLHICLQLFFEHISSLLHVPDVVNAHA